MDTPRQSELYKLIQVAANRHSETENALASALVFTDPSALKDAKMEWARSDTSAPPTDEGEEFASLLSFIGSTDRSQTTIASAVRKATFWSERCHYRESGVSKTNCTLSVSGLPTRDRYSGISSKLTW